MRKVGTTRPNSIAIGLSLLLVAWRQTQPPRGFPRPLWRRWAGRSIFRAAGAMMAKTQEKQADFGFRRVPLGEKQGLVDNVFHSVARRYDLMNDLMSGGLHRAWKEALVTAVNPPKKELAFSV